MSGPFALHIPSIFVVCSPFQALCAVSTMKNLEISDYDFIAVLSGGSRDEQLLAYLKKMNINYSVFRLNKINLLKNIIKNILTLHGKYERAFIGEFSASFMLGVALPQLTRKANAVYIDDGNAMISFLNNTFRSWDKRITRWVFDVLAERKRIEPRKNFYTIYSDIPNDKYKINHNDISIILTDAQIAKTEKNIILIGTNIHNYCSQLDISEDSFCRQIRRVFELIHQRYPDETIIYVPHSNETVEFINKLCDEIGAQITPVDTMIEVFVAESPWKPKAIVGFCSTALLNIRHLMPMVPAINILIYGSSNCPRLNKYKSICSYYQRNQIECLEWEIN